MNWEYRKRDKYTLLKLLLKVKGMECKYIYFLNNWEV